MWKCLSMKTGNCCHAELILWKQNMFPIIFYVFSTLMWCWLLTLILMEPRQQWRLAHRRYCRLDVGPTLAQPTLLSGKTRICVILTHLSQNILLSTPEGPIENVISSFCHIFTLYMNYIRLQTQAIAMDTDVMANLMSNEDVLPSEKPVRIEHFIVVCIEHFIVVCHGHFSISCQRATRWWDLSCWVSLIDVIIMFCFHVWVAFVMWCFLKHKNRKSSNLFLLTKIFMLYVPNCFKGLLMT